MPRRKSISKLNANRPSAVVCILASNSDQEDLLALLGPMPESTGLSYVILQPVGRAVDVNMLTALALPIHRVESRCTLLADQIYLCPDQLDLTYSNGEIRRHSTQERAIDNFLTHLSEDLGARAIGLVLRGADGEGVDGLLAIRSEGGVTYAAGDGEHKADPDFSAADVVDYVLSPGAIASELLRLAQHPFLAQPAEADSTQFSEDYLVRIFRLLRHQSGVDFSVYKPTTVRRRVMRRMLLQHFDSLDKYYQSLRQSPEAVDQLYQDLLISVTGLFRDAAVYEALSQRVLPEILDSLEPDQTVRIWVPGCSKGDEVYSIAIALLEVMGERKRNHPVQIFATDVNERSLEQARAGVYPESLPEEIGTTRVNRFFHKVDRGYQISKSIRDLCIFARQDLTRDPPFSRLDLISCRNVLIYLNPTLQYKIMRIFHYALRPTGYLLLGASESLGRASEFFVQSDRVLRFYSRRATPTPMLLESFDATASVLNVPRDSGRSPVGQTPRPSSLVDVQKEADRLVLARYAPPGVLVNEELEILQFRGRTGPYLEHPSGSVTHNLLKLAREGLLSDLRRALQETRDRDVPVLREGLRVRTDEGWTQLDLEVFPFTTPRTRERFFLVLFKPLASGISSDPGPSSLSQADIELELVHLRQELTATREYLSAINQEQEATLGSLQAANEEVQSANEELQSTNEELVTAKEELQSTNEELTTVNEELHERNRELTALNNDLTNLLSSVSIPVVILGADMRIRRFTPMARQVLKVIPSDIGRHIGDLRPNLEIPNLESRIQEVLETLCPQQLELQDRDGRWYSVRIRLYRTTDNRIDGAILVFVDVDALRRSLDAVQQAHDLVRWMTDQHHQPQAILNDDFSLREANGLFFELFQLDPDDARQRSFFELCPQWERSALRNRLEAIVAEDHNGEWTVTGPSGQSVRLVSQRLESGRVIVLSLLTTS